APIRKSEFIILCYRSNMRLFLKDGLHIFVALFLFAATGQDLHAQKKRSSSQKDPAVIAGDKYYNVFDYIKAAEEYKKAYEADTTNKYALFRLAESYRMYYDYFNSEKYYKIATRSALREYPMSRYWYAILLKDNGNYVEAIEQFNLFRQEYKAATLEAELYKEKALQEARGCETAMRELKKPQRDYNFKSLPVPANSELADFSVVIIENDSVVALTSSREESKGKTEGGMGGSLTDIYRFKKGNGEEWTPISHDQDGFGIMNTPFNESAGSFTEDRT